MHGWRDKNAFSHFLLSQEIMKDAMDAAHARGLILRPIKNSILQLAQVSENLLEARIKEASPQSNARQRDSLALMVRKLIKRFIQLSPSEALKVDNNQVDKEEEDELKAKAQALYGKGMASKLCFRKLMVKQKAEEQNKKIKKAEQNWENAPYALRLTLPPKFINDEDHDIGVPPHYLETLLLPGHRALRKDLKVVLAFTLSQDGKDYLPAGIVVYGTCKSKVESEKSIGEEKEEEHANRYVNDYVHFLRKRRQDLLETYTDEEINAKSMVEKEGDLEALETYENHAAIYDLNDKNDRKISCLQNYAYDNRIAEIYVLCSQDPNELAWEKEKKSSGNPLPLASGGTILLAFTLAFIGSEKLTLKKSNGLRHYINEYAGVVMELAPDTQLLDELKLAKKSKEEIEQAKRGSQVLRNISRKMGFSSQPIITTSQSKQVNGIKIPSFDDEPQPRKRWSIQNNSYVSLFLPTRDYFPLTKISQSLPLHVKGENGAVLGFKSSACPNKRGKGVTSCL